MDNTQILIKILQQQRNQALDLLAEAFVKIAELEQKAKESNDLP